MAETNVNYKYKNGELRERSTFGAEYVVANDGTLASTDTAGLGGLPKNIVLTGVRVIGIGLGAATVPTVTINSVGYTLAASDIDDDVVECVVSAPVLLTDAEAVSFGADVDITAGRVIVLVDYIEFDRTTGLRTEPV